VAAHTHTHLETKEGREIHTVKETLKRPSDRHAYVVRTSPSLKKAAERIDTQRKREIR